MIGREALLRTWLAANHAHSIAALNSAPPATNAAAPNLRELAKRELSTPGRYQLTKPALPSA
ncbi:MAG TPA: hypothetical protein VKE42_12570, partial [Candidatus Cybelea sp.]|nr:hypothetical protein [Candidatus Cybelea sp.]